MGKTASLTAGLVAKKGQAAPAVVTPPVTPVVEQPVTKIHDKSYFKALTVKLDKDRYQRLKQLGVMRDKSSQDLFVEALDKLLAEASELHE